MKIRQGVDEYLFALVNFVTLDVDLLTPIVMYFRATGRDTSSYDFSDDVSESIYAGESNFAVGNGFLQCTMLEELKKTLAFYGHVITTEEEPKWFSLFQACFRKTDSTYGVSVKNYGEYDADALITIKGKNSVV